MIHARMRTRFRSECNRPIHCEPQPRKNPMQNADPYRTPPGKQVKIIETSGAKDIEKRINEALQEGYDIYSTHYAATNMCAYCLVIMVKKQ